MNPRLRFATTFIGLTFALAGCGSINVGSVWPFGKDDKQPERSRAPANSTEYVCKGNKRFYVRSLDGGAAAWVIYPEREFRLPKTEGGTGTRYSNGGTTLDIDGAAATVTDSTGQPYENCKAQQAAAG